MSYSITLRATVLAGLSLLAGSCAAYADDFSTLYQFQGGSDGANPVSPLLVGSNNALYGTTLAGALGAGTFFELNGQPGDTVLHSFVNNGSAPLGQLIAYKYSFVGTKFGLSAGVPGDLFQLKLSASAPIVWKDNPIHVFGGTAAGDGADPRGGITKDGSSVYFGVTTAGGTAGCKGFTDDGSDGCGTVFRTTPTAVPGGPWTESAIYRFAGGTDGAVPANALLKAKGALFGVTALGGTGICNLPNSSGGCGTVFEITPQGVKTTIYSFTGGADGAFPAGKLVFVSGAFYGTTTQGGSNGCGGNGCGTVFRLKPPAKVGAPWEEKIIAAFAGGNDGATPLAGLSAPLSSTNRALALYGTTTLGGGAGCGGSGCGTVFKIPFTNPYNLTLGAETVIHAFTGGADGAFPVAEFIDTARYGDLVGTTEFGGTSSCPSGKVLAGFQGCGTIFAVTPNY